MTGESVKTKISTVASSSLPMASWFPRQPNRVRVSMPVRWCCHEEDTIHQSDDQENHLSPTRSSSLSSGGRWRRISGLSGAFVFIPPDSSSSDSSSPRLTPPPQGSRGLSLFYAEVRRDPQGRLEGIEVQRLKDKLGTRQMPTAELLLDGLPAHRVSGSPPTPHPGG